MTFTARGRESSVIEHVANSLAVDERFREQETLGWADGFAERRHSLVGIVCRLVPVVVSLCLCRRYSPEQSTVLLFGFLGYRFAMDKIEHFLSQLVLSNAFVWGFVVLFHDSFKGFKRLKGEEFEITMDI